MNAETLQKHNRRSSPFISDEFEFSGTFLGTYLHYSTMNVPRWMRCESMYRSTVYSPAENTNSVL